MDRAQLDAMNQQRTSSEWAPGPPTAIANQEYIGLTVAGNSSAPITINDMAIVKHCGHPLTGDTLFYAPSEGAGPFGVAHIEFDLDEPVSIGQYGTYPGDTTPPGGNFFAKKVVTLQYHEPQTFGIYVSTDHQYCTFTFNLSIATINGPATQTITDNGKPFALTADGETGADLMAAQRSKVPFSSYAVVYAGGVADQQHNYKFIRVNPATYHGTGDPAAFPPP